MKLIVTKLKRYKTMCLILNILSLPIRLPFFIFYKIGELSEIILGNIDSRLYKISDSIAKVFKFEEVAKEQYKTNKDKFKIGK